MSEQAYLKLEIKKELQKLGLNDKLECYTVNFSLGTYSLEDFDDIILLEKLFFDLQKQAVTITKSK